MPCRFLAPLSLPKREWSGDFHPKGSAEQEVAIKKIDKVELKAHDHEALHEEVTLSLFLSLCN